MLLLVQPWQASRIYLPDVFPCIHSWSRISRYPEPELVGGEDPGSIEERERGAPPGKAPPSVCWNEDSGDSLQTCLQSSLEPGRISEARQQKARPPWQGLARPQPGPQAASPNVQHPPSIQSAGNLVLDSSRVPRRPVNPLPVQMQILPEPRGIDTLGFLVLTLVKKLGAPPPALLVRAHQG